MEAHLHGRLIKVIVEAWNTGSWGCLLSEAHGHVYANKLAIFDYHEMMSNDPNTS